ncbi:MAG TPA: hypothetical protein VE057_17925 [Archangium sp.]|nr:hypothetical protein [Archangium sp.]
MDLYFPGWREATDEWVLLRKELAAVQAARVQAEAAHSCLATEHFNLRQDRDAQRQRAERAERERDEARRLHGKTVLDGSAAVSRAERAEADKAALLEQAVHAAAERRHAYRVKEDWNLVARAIEPLERATSSVLAERESTSA